jgi:hypothetical protein
MSKAPLYKYRLAKTSNTGKYNTKPSTSKKKNTTTNTFKNNADNFVFTKDKNDFLKSVNDSLSSPEEVDKIYKNLLNATKRLRKLRNKLKKFYVIYTGSYFTDKVPKLGYKFEGRPAYYKDAVFKNKDKSIPYDSKAFVKIRKVTLSIIDTMTNNKIFTGGFVDMDEDGFNNFFKDIINYSFKGHEDLLSQLKRTFETSFGTRMSGTDQSMDTNQKINQLATMIITDGEFQTLIDFTTIESTLKSLVYGGRNNIYDNNNIQLFMSNKFIKIMESAHKTIGFSKIELLSMTFNLMLSYTKLVLSGESNNYDKDILVAIRMNIMRVLSDINTEYSKNMDTLPMDEEISSTNANNYPSLSTNINGRNNDEPITEVSNLSQSYIEVNINNGSYKKNCGNIVNANGAMPELTQSATIKYNKLNGAPTCTNDTYNQEFHIKENRVTVTSMSGSANNTFKQPVNSNRINASDTINIMNFNNSRKSLEDTNQVISKRARKLPKNLIVDTPASLQNTVANANTKVTSANLSSRNNVISMPAQTDMENTSETFLEQGGNRPNKRKREHHAVNFSNATVEQKIANILEVIYTYISGHKNSSSGIEQSYNVARSSLNTDSASDIVYPFSSYTMLPLALATLEQEIGSIQGDGKMINSSSKILEIGSPNFINSLYNSISKIDTYRKSTNGKKYSGTVKKDFLKALNNIKRYLNSKSNQSNLAFQIDYENTGEMEDDTNQFEFTSLTDKTSFPVIKDLLSIMNSLLPGP